MKKFMPIFAIIAAMTGVFVQARLASAATLPPPTVFITANGGTVSVHSESKGLLQCNTSATPGECMYESGWVFNNPASPIPPAHDALTITVTPPTGRVVTSWGNTACTDGSNTCVLLYDLETTLKLKDKKYITLSYASAPTPQPAPTPSQPARTTPTTSTPTTSPAPVVNPNAPTISEPIKQLAFDDTLYSTDPNTKLSFPAGKDVRVSGKTFPSAKVELTIYSTPRTATVTADKDGVWTYVISGLEAGDHRVEAKVTDPISGNTSENKLLATFSVIAPPAVAVKNSSTPSQSSTDTAKQSLIVPGVAILLGCIVAGIAVWQYVRTRKKSAKLPTAISPDQVNLSQDDVKQP